MLPNRFSLFDLLLLLVGGSRVNTDIDHGGSSLLPELVDGSKEAILRGSVGLSVPLLIVPTLSA